MVNINIKEKPFWAGFILSTVLFPIFLLFILFSIESVILRFFPDISNSVPYSFLYLFFLISAGISSFAVCCLDFIPEFKCIHCLKIFRKNEIINIAHKTKQDFYYSDICKPCLADLAKKHTKGRGRK